MNSYNFLEDVLDTYQSMAPLMQFAWLVVPLLFVLALIMVFLHHLRHCPQKRDQPPPPAILYEEWHEHPSEDIHQTLIDMREDRLRK